MRKGSANTQRGAKRFVEELIARLRRAGASGEIVARFDSGYWSNQTIATLGRLNVRYTMAVRTNTRGLDTAIAAIDEDAWVDIDYTPDGQAQVADTTYHGRRLGVRRTRLTEVRQARFTARVATAAFSCMTRRSERSARSRTAKVDPCGVRA